MFLILFKLLILITLIALAIFGFANKQVRTVMLAVVKRYLIQLTITVSIFVLIVVISQIGT